MIVDNNCLNKITNLLKTFRNKTIICIEGPAASGKTTLAASLNLPVIHLDDFFLPDELKTKERLSEVGGNIDYERFIKEVLIPLKKDKPFSYQAYDCKTKTFISKYFENKNKIILIEGVYSFHPLFRPYYDFLIYCNITKEEQLKRLKQRSSSLYNMFINEWLIYEDKYFSKTEPIKFANLIFD